jgi:hypothetical protein
MMTLLLNVSATLLFALTALLGRGPGPGPGSGNGNGNGSGNGNGGPSGTPCAACQVTDPAATPLSATEKESLLYMREEEKLARDVYNAFYDRYGLRVFSNIAASEQAHMDAVLTLLNRYSLADPAPAAAGVFHNDDLQALYDDLIDQGNQSLTAALQAAVLIEQTDIADLQDSLALITHADLRAVYSNLLRASQNHLRAFSRQLP